MPLKKDLKQTSNMLNISLILREEAANLRVHENKQSDRQVDACKFKQKYKNRSKNVKLESKGSITA